MPNTIYLSLGSNLGDRLAYLRQAITYLPSSVEPELGSSVYETEPWGYSDQPPFLNMVLRANTTLQPDDLLEYLKNIEVQMGRQETFRFGPRLIDIDILFYDQLLINTTSLTIPHPRIAERAFVLVPLAEIAPDLVHPGLAKTIQELKNMVDPSSIKLVQSAIM